MITNRSMPPPELPYNDVQKAMAWLCQAFGYKERLRIGNHRRQLDDVSNRYERAKQSGARIINPPTDYPFGERQYTVEDSSGPRWISSQTIADIDPTTWGGELPEN